MDEHRAIEKALNLMSMEKDRMENGVMDEDVVWNQVDFISVVGDDFHHGKEENILFPAVKGKPRSFEFDEITTILMQEHANIRSLVRTVRET